MVQAEISLESLPEHILENIFYFLNHDDLIEIRKASQIIDNCYLNYLRRSLLILRKDISTLLKQIYYKIKYDSDTIFQTKRYIKIYSILESVDEKLEIINILQRNLSDAEFTFQTELFLNKSYQILNKTKEETINMQELNTFYLTFELCFAYFIENIHNFNTVNKRIPLGVQTIDFLDSMKDVFYKIVVDYNIYLKTCNAILKYYLKTPKLILYLPLINFMGNYNSKCLREKEQIALIEYFLKLINLHNKMVLKNRQYQRELVTLNGDADEKLFSPMKIYKERKVKDLSKGVFQEIYENKYRLNELRDAIKLSVRLTCPIHIAPLQIFNNFMTLQNDIEANFTNKPLNALETKLRKRYYFNLNMTLIKLTGKKEILEINFHEEK